MAVPLQDLTFIEQGNPDYIGELINFEKRVLVSSVLDSVQRYQKVAFKRPPDSERRRGPPAHLVATFIATHERQSDDDLYAASLRVEPRGADQRALRM